MSKAKLASSTWFEVDAAVLAEALATVTSACERRETIPILNTVLIEMADGNLSLTATDLDVTLKTSIDTGGDGSSLALALHARQLLGIASKTSGGLSFSLDGEQVKIESSDSKITLPAWKRAKYPSAQQVETGTISLSAQMLLSMIHQTKYAIHKETGRWNVLAARLRSKDGQIEMVTNDSDRLSIATRAVEIEDFEIVIPKRALSILRLILEDAETVTVNETDNLLRFDVAGISLIARKLSRVFPLIVDRIIQETVATEKLIFNTAAVRHALDRMGDFADGTKHHVRLDIADKLTVSYSGQDRGEASIVIPTNYKGEPIALGLNRQYLLDALGSIEADEFDFSFSDFDKPIMIKSDGYKAIVMTCRLL